MVDLEGTAENSIHSSPTTRNVWRVRDFRLDALGLSGELRRLEDKGGDFYLRWEGEVRGL